MRACVYLRVLRWVCAAHARGRWCVWVLTAARGWRAAGGRRRGAAAARPRGAAARSPARARRAPPAAGSTRLCPGPLHWKKKQISEAEWPLNQIVSNYGYQAGGPSFESWQGGHLCLSQIFVTYQVMNVLYVFNYIFKYMYVSMYYPYKNRSHNTNVVKLTTKPAKSICVKVFHDIYLLTSSSNPTACVKFPIRPLIRKGL